MPCIPTREACCGRFRRCPGKTLESINSCSLLRAVHPIRRASLKGAPSSPVARRRCRLAPRGRRKKCNRRPCDGCGVSTMGDEKRAQASEPAALVRAQGLSKRYVQRRRFSRKVFVVSALDNLDLSIQAGRTLAVVGPSGSGKSTLGRCLARLEEPGSGEIWFGDKNLLTLTARELLHVREQTQLVFQGPAATFNPRFSALQIVSEPLAIQGRGSRQDRRRRAQELMDQVGLPSVCRERRPLELSGGQRQRLAIARALTLEPKFLILDEALSGLDLSIQAQIVNLLVELQDLYCLTYLF